MGSDRIIAVSSYWGSVPVLIMAAIAVATIVAKPANLTHTLRSVSVDLRSRDAHHEDTYAGGQFSIRHHFAPAGVRLSPAGGRMAIVRWPEWPLSRQRDHLRDRSLFPGSCNAGSRPTRRSARAGLRPRGGRWRPL